MQLAVSIVWVLLCIVFLGLVYSMYSVRKKLVPIPIRKGNEEKLETGSIRKEIEANEQVGENKSGDSNESDTEVNSKVSPTMELLIDGKQYRFKAKKVHVVINGENIEIEVADDNAGDISVEHPKNEISDVISQSSIDNEKYRILNASEKARLERLREELEKKDDDGDENYKDDDEGDENYKNGDGDENYENS